MRKNNTATLLLIAGISVASLSACQQMEQAATEAVETARQTAVQTLEEVRQAGSLDEARQSASQALENTKQQAAGLLGQASEYLSNEPQQQEQPATENPTTAL